MKNKEIISGKIYLLLGTTLLFIGIISASIPVVIIGLDADTLDSLSCSTNQIPKWNGTEWKCNADLGNSTSEIWTVVYNNTFVDWNSVPTCSGTNKLTYNGSHLSCIVDVDTWNSTNDFWAIANNGSLTHYNGWYNSTLINQTTLEDIGGNLSVKQSWVQQVFNWVFGTKTTDDLTQGTTNKYDNQSWNQSLANTLYVNKTIMLGNTTIEIWGVVNNGTFMPLGIKVGNTSSEIWTIINNNTFIPFGTKIGNTSTEMQTAINTTNYYQFKVNWSNVLNSPSFTDTDTFNTSAQIWFVINNGTFMPIATKVGNTTAEIQAVAIAVGTKLGNTTNEIWAVTDNITFIKFTDLPLANRTTISWKNITDIPTCSGGTNLFFNGSVLNCTTGVDTDTFNTTQQMRDALNNSGGIYNLTSNVSVYWNNSIGANTTQHSFLGGIISILPSWVLSIIPDNWGGNQTRIENNIIGNGTLFMNGTAVLNNSAGTWNITANKSIYWNGSSGYNMTEFDNNAGTLTHKLTWLYQTIRDIVTPMLTNFARTNQSNEWTQVQNFTGGIYLPNNATISRNGSGTKIFISDGGNVITRFSE